MLNENVNKRKESKTTSHCINIPPDLVVPVRRGVAVGGVVVGGGGAVPMAHNSMCRKQSVKGKKK